MRKAKRMRLRTTLVVFLLICAGISCEKSSENDNAPARMKAQRLPVSPAVAKRELRLRSFFREAVYNPTLAKYMRETELSLNAMLSNWSTCAIVDALNAGFVLNASLGADTTASEIPGELATRVCAIISESSAQQISGGWLVTVEDLPSTIEWPVVQKRLEGICKTGFLYLQNDIVATSLHGACTTGYLCVFDFKVHAGSSEAPTFYSNSQVRRIQGVVADGFDDWSLLQLEDPMAREPLQPSDQEVEDDDEVFSLGHPYGLPLKFAGVNDVICNAVEQADECPYFKSNLIMYNQNSGSPVFRTDGSLVGLYTHHWGDTLIAYEGNEVCYLLEGLDDCANPEGVEDPSNCCDLFCGSADALRISHVELDAEEEEPEVVEIVNNASNNAYFQMGNNLQVIQLEPGKKIRKPLSKTAAVWLLSCGQRHGDWRCDLLRLPVRPGERWRITDEQSPDSHIQPGTRVVMKRVESKH